MNKSIARLTVILVWKIASLRIIVIITVCTRKKSNEWIEHSNLFQICWHWCELLAVPDNCGATNEGRLFRWTIFLHIIFFSQILLEQNQGRDFPDFRLPHNVCDRWRCNQPMEGRKGMTLQVDEKGKGGRRGEGYCLITQSQATTLGWYFIEAMKMSNCQKYLIDGVCFPLCAMCLFGSSAGHRLKCLI